MGLNLSQARPPEKQGQLSNVGCAKPTFCNRPMSVIRSVSFRSTDGGQLIGGYGWKTDIKETY